MFEPCQPESLKSMPSTTPRCPGLGSTNGKPKSVRSINTDRLSQAKTGVHSHLAQEVFAKGGARQAILAAHIPNITGIGKYGALNYAKQLLAQFGISF